MRWEILLLEPVNDWFLALCKNDPAVADKVAEALDELSDSGPQLGRPLVDRVHSSKIHNLKELRPRVPGTARGAPAVCIRPGPGGDSAGGGDKAGRWSAWYTEVIPVAEERYAAYRREADEKE